MSRSVYLAAFPLLGVLACGNMSRVVGAEAQPSRERSRMNVTQYYNDACAKCHGEQAQGGGGGTPSLISKEKYDQGLDRKFFDAIKNGVPDMGMEAYGETLSDTEVWALVVHIRELQGRGLRAKFGGPKRSGNITQTSRANYRVETVLGTDSGFETPWSIEFLDGGRMLIANRPGRLDVAKNGRVVGEVRGIPTVRELGQGGLMDVVLHPTNGYLYIAYSEAGKERGALTKIVRGKLKWSGDSADWTGQQVLWEADQKYYTNAGVHFGSRIVFDGKGMMYFVVGERGGNEKAQLLDNPFGKIFRLKEDGTEPSDNPFFGKSPIKGIWSYGHRNPQGLTIDAEGNLWATEHGPRGGDELNLIRKGANYGWPIYGYSINYNDTPINHPFAPASAKIDAPVYRWIPSIGACGLDAVKGTQFPGWKGDLLAGGLSGRNVDRFRVKNGKLVEREEILYGLGRVRDVEEGPDGFVYVVLNDPNEVIRLIPVK